MASTAKVLVFDSGVGGLTIVDEIRNLMPDLQVYFACDNAAFPYGTKSEHFLLNRVDHALKALIRHIQPDIVVVACNTASTLILPQIRSYFSNPVVGVVPAIKPAAQISQSKVVGLLATPGTIARDYTRKLIDQFARDCRVITVGSSELVYLAEQKLRGETIDPDFLMRIVEPFFSEPDLDTLVLACTHFPLLSHELLAVAPRQVHWVDSGNAIARRVKSLLSEAQLQSKQTEKTAALFSRHDDTLVRLAPGLAQYGFDDIEIVDF